MSCGPLGPCYKFVSLVETGVNERVMCRGEMHGKEAGETMTRSDEQAATLKAAKGCSHCG